jgi:hypothetical protein
VSDDPIANFLQAAALVWTVARLVWAEPVSHPALLGLLVALLLVAGARRLEAWEHQRRSTRSSLKRAADVARRATNTALLRRLWWRFRPPLDLMVVDGLMIDRTRRAHCGWFGPTGAGKSAAVATTRVNGARPTLVATPDISDPMREATQRLGGLIWTACESDVPIDFLLGEPTEVAERLTEAFRSGGVGAWKRTTRLATAGVVRRLDLEGEPRSLVGVGRNLEAAIAKDRELRTICGGWVARFLDLADQFGPSIGAGGVDLAQLLAAGRTVVLDVDAFAHPSLGGDVVALALAEAKRCAPLVPGGFRLIFEEAGQLGDRIDLAEPFHRAGRRRLIAVDDITQAESDLDFHGNDGITANLSTRVYFAQELGSLQRVAADRLGLEPGELDPAAMADYTAWVAHGRIRRLVRFPKPPAARPVETVETARTFSFRVWKQRGGNSEPAGIQALSGRPVYALPAPPRAEMPEWIRGVAVREAIWELLAGTDYEDGCWLWQGERHPKGYGRFRRTIDGMKWDLLTHRAMYEYANGPIPEGWTVDHCCEPVPTTRCGNPRHLKLESRPANTRLRWEREKARTGG